MMISLTDTKMGTIIKKIGGGIMTKPTIVLQKNAEKSTNKIRLPKSFIEMNGSKFYMDIYQDKIILRPIKKV